MTYIILNLIYQIALMYKIEYLYPNFILYVYKFSSFIKKFPT